MCPVIWPNSAARTHTQPMSTAARTWPGGGAGGRASPGSDDDADGDDAHDGRAVMMARLQISLGAQRLAKEAVEHASPPCASRVQADLAQGKANRLLQLSAASPGPRSTAMHGARQCSRPRHYGKDPVDGS